MPSVSFGIKIRCPSLRTPKVRVKRTRCKISEDTLNMSIANGQRSKEDSLTTTVTVGIEGRKFHTNFIVLPEAKGNRTLLRRDYLDKSRFVTDVNPFRRGVLKKGHLILIPKSDKRHQEYLTKIFLL